MIQIKPLTRYDPQRIIQRMPSHQNHPILMASPTRRQQNAMTSKYLQHLGIKTRRLSHPALILNGHYLRSSGGQTTAFQWQHIAAAGQHWQSQNNARLYMMLGLQYHGNNGNICASSMLRYDPGRQTSPCRRGTAALL